MCIRDRNTSKELRDVFTSGSNQASFSNVAGDKNPIHVLIDNGRVFGKDKRLESLEEILEYDGADLAVYLDLRGTDVNTVEGRRLLEAVNYFDSARSRWESALSITNDLGSKPLTNNEWYRRPMLMYTQFTTRYLSLIHISEPTRPY